MKRRDFLRVAAGLAVTGAASAQRPRPRVALVLGGGGCRGYGHIGVIRALDKHGLKPDLVVGSSAGSLVGGLYAAGLSADRLAKLGSRMTPNMLRDWIFPKLGIFGGDGIRPAINSLRISSGKPRVSGPNTKTLPDSNFTLT